MCLFPPRGGRGKATADGARASLAVAVHYTGSFRSLQRLFYFAASARKSKNPENLIFRKRHEKISENHRNRESPPSAAGARRPGGSAAAAAVRRRHGKVQKVHFLRFP